MYVFSQKIIEVKDEVIDKMKKNKEFIFNANNRRDFNTATKCFICRKDFQQGDGGLETIATLQRDKGDVLTMTIRNNLLCVITKFQFSFIISRTMTVI